MVGGLHTRLGGSIGVHPTLCHILPPPSLEVFQALCHLHQLAIPPPLLLYVLQP